MELFHYSLPEDPEAPEVIRPRCEQSIIRKVSYTREYGNAIGAALGHGEASEMVTVGDTHAIGFQHTGNFSNEWHGYASSEPTCLTQIHTALSSTNL